MITRVITNLNFSFFLHFKYSLLLPFYLLLLFESCTTVCCTSKLMATAFSYFQGGKLFIYLKYVFMRKYEYVYIFEYKNRAWTATEPSARFNGNQWAKGILMNCTSICIRNCFNSNSISKPSLFLVFFFFYFNIFSGVFLIECTNKPESVVVAVDLLIELHFTFGSWLCFLIINWFIWLAAWQLVLFSLYTPHVQVAA